MAYDGSGFHDELGYGDGRGGDADRISVHLCWEAVLLAFLGMGLYLLRKDAPEALGNPGRGELLMSAAIVGLVAIGGSFSLRAAVPNLALGPVACAGAVFFADRLDGGLTTAALTTALAAAGIGAVIAVLTVGFNVPAWAASLAVGVALMAWLERHADVLVPAGAYHPSGHALFWFLGFVVLSVAGGWFSSIGPIRSTIGGYRPAGDPEQRRPAVAAVLALVCSAVLASVAGVLLALRARQVGAGDGGLGLTILALGAPLLGGVSAYGRRGGISGTALGVTLLILAERLGQGLGWDLTDLAVGAVAILAGLVVTRLVETFGHGKPNEGQHWLLRGPARWARNRWSSGREGWPAQLAARDDEGWDSAGQWGVR